MKPPGNCYRAAFDRAMLLADEGKAFVVLVHGPAIPTSGPWSRQRITHAWVEVGTDVYESSNGNARAILVAGVGGWEDAGMGNSGIALCESPWYAERRGRRARDILNHDFGRYLPCDIVSSLSRMKTASTSPKSLRFLVAFRKGRRVRKRSTTSRKLSPGIWRVSRHMVSQFHRP